MARWRAVGLALVFAAAASTARAGPPYVTDDPEPTDLGHWEIYNFVTATTTPGDTAGEAGIDLNYGAAKDVQLTMVIPAAFDNLDRLGAADLQLAAKFKLLHQQDGSWMPDLAVFPRAFVPTGARFDPERPGVLLPVWLGKDFGPWSVFGGAGLMINPGAGERNYWQSGLVVSRQLGRLSLGAEVFHMTPQDRRSVDFTGADIGATYALSRNWTLMISGGPGVQHARQNGEGFIYAALEATY
jgi:hypothetical protein